MQKVIAKHRGSETVYHHLESDRYFGRVVAGIGFPGKSPGFCCVFAEDRHKDTGLKIRHVHLLAEVEETVTGELLRKLADISESYEVQDIYGFLTDQDLYYLHHWNESAERHNRPTLYIQPAPFMEDNRLESYVRILQDRLDPANKSVHLCEGSKLQGYLLQLPFDEIHQATEKDYPAIAAACYAVSSLTIWEPFNDADLPTNYLDESDQLLDIGV